MALIDQIAAKFVHDLPPTGASGEVRLEFLHYYGQQAAAVIAALPDPESVLADNAIRATDAATDAIESAWKTNQALQLNGDVARDFLVAAFVRASYGMQMHHPTSMQAIVADGLLDPAQLASDYLARLGTFQMIVKLGKSGVLTPLFKSKSATSGVGFIDPLSFAIIAAVVVTVVQVALIVALAYYAVARTSIVEGNKLWDKQIKQTCYGPNGVPTTNTQNCVQTMMQQKFNQEQEDMSKRDKVWQDLAQTALKYVAGGVAIYVGIMVLPDIIKSLRESRQAAKA